MNFLSYEFDASPSLKNQRLAYYEWGSGEITFADLPEMTNIIAGKSFFQLSHGLNTLEEQDELICLIALVHEYRHFQQDYATGVGNWDFLAQSNQALSRLGLAKIMARGDAALEKLDPDIAKMRDPSERPLLFRKPEDELKTILQNSSNQSTSLKEVAELLTVGRILELDAVLFTEDIVTETRCSKKARENIRLIRNYFSILKLPDFYSESYLMAMRTLESRVTFPDFDTNVYNTYLLAIRITICLSLAFPPPSYFEKNGTSPDKYHPGVRFIDTLAAVISVLIDSSIEIERIDQLEPAIMDVTGDKYLSYSDTINFWIDEFDNLKDHPFPAVIEARSQVLKNKVENVQKTPGSGTLIERDIRSRNLMELLLANVDVQARREDGKSQKILISGGTLADPSYDFDRRRFTIVKRLSDFISNDQRGFQCPLASTGMCDV